MILNIVQKPKEALAVKDSSGLALSYGDLVAFSEAIKSVLPERSLVFMMTRNNAGGVAWVIALLQNRIVPLIMNAQMASELYRQLYDLYRPAYICVPESELAHYDYTVIFQGYGYALVATGCPSYGLYPELSHLLPTSGSTGSPKLVRHCYANIEAAALNISTFFELTPNDRALMVLPLYYTMGLSMVFSHFYAGATLLITDLNMTDRNFWRFIKEERASSLTGVPYSFEIMNLMRFFRMDLPDLTLLTQGGGKMPKELNLKFAEYCREHGKRWIATYGQSEGTARMAYLPPEWAISKVGSIGRAVPNGELSLIDSEGNQITTPYTEGEMCYRGKNVTLGYAYKKEDLSLGDERHGFMRTGDLAYFDEDHCFYIVGRMGRFLKLFGMRVGLDECEQIIKAKYSVDCACVGTDEKMIVYITNSTLEKGVKEELVDKTHLVASAFEVRYLSELPRSGAGKILYSQLSNK